MLKYRHFGISVMFVVFVRPLSSYVLPPPPPPTSFTSKQPPCPSEIYCHGNLLHTVQMAHLFADSKTFVDMKLKNSPEITLEKFNDMMNLNNNSPSKEKVKQFVNDNFDPPGAELEDYLPPDWIAKPKFLDSVVDPELKDYGSKLNDLWKILGRKMKPEIKEHPELYSIIYVENPVIVPGGRFREFYYWDSFWTIKGLLHCEMKDTVRGMLLNFLSIVERYGFIPNGGRVYYTQRSQPPFLIPMVKAYVDATGDGNFAIDAVKTLEHEFKFWMNNHTQVVNGHVLASYGDKSSGPRPESYREDIETASIYETEEEKEECYSELKAGAESGMDFSSRFFISENGTNEGTLKDLKTRSIIPVDLNALLYWNAKILSKFYMLAGNSDKVQEYEKMAQEILTAIEDVLWSDEVGIWLDYDMINKKHRNYFTPTNLSPLFTGAFSQEKTESISKSVLKYIETLGLDAFPGGVPNTLQSTGEQWDYPNVWPPMQHLMIIGLDNLETPATKELARKWAERWVHSNHEAFKRTTHMFEKYNAEEFGGHGGGGEYSVQLGFGWSNGVIIDLLSKYGSMFTTNAISNTTNNLSA